MKAASASEISALTAIAVDWLVESGLGGSDVPALVAGLGRRLNSGGIGVERAGCAVLTLHPQIVSHEVTWQADNDRAATEYYTPKLMEDPKNRRGPYFDLALNRLTYKRYVLADRPLGEGMSLLARLQAEGYAEYGFFHATGGAAAITPFARRVGLVPCVVGSFATRRQGGFTEGEISCFKVISKTLALATKARTNFETGARLLDIYLGRACGAQVLDGRIMRGDCERIPCGFSSATCGSRRVSSHGSPSTTTSLFSIAISMSLPER
jgi:adenylate cyclase